ncbi:TPA: hypothetical protein ENS27_09335 [bacterium]|nr:hypothetical protein [bacterium]
MKLGLVVFIISLFILISGIFILTSAQDDVHIVVDEKENIGEKAVIIMEAPITNDASMPQRRVFMRSENGNINIKDSGEAGSERAERRSRRENKESFQENQYQDKMQRESQMKDNVKNAESARKMRESIQSSVKEQPKDMSANNIKQPVGQMPPQPDGDKLNQYLKVIGEKNLFLALGTIKREEKAAYAVTAIISNTSQESKPKAIIEQMGANRSFYVSEGDSLADMSKVTDIKENQVKVNRSGEEMTLMLGIGTQGGGKWQGGGGPPPDRRDFQKEGQPSDVAKPSFRAEGAQMGGTPNLDNLPPMVKKMLEDRGISIEELKNNPELQQKLRQEFMQRFGGRGASGQ